MISLLGVPTVIQCTCLYCVYFLAAYAFYNRDCSKGFRDRAPFKSISPISLFLKKYNFTHENTFTHTEHKASNSFILKGIKVVQTYNPDIFKN